MTAPAPPVANGLLDAIGATPMVELTRLAPSPDVRIFAKLEGANPTGSVKDRVALAMVREAEAAGLLQPGRTILEPSSGNTGISLALIGLLHGYPVRIVMPDNTTAERERLLRLYGAEIVHSPGAEGSNGAIRLAQRLADEDPALFMPYQYGNEANPAGPRARHRPGDPGPGPRCRRLRRGAGDRWHADRGRTSPQGGSSRRARHRRRADAGRDGPGPPLPGRGVRPAGPRRIRSSTTASS